MLYIKYVCCIFLFSWTTIDGEEQVCSKFHYEEQLLQKMVKLEFELIQMKQEKDKKVSAFSAYNPSPLTPNINQVIVFKNVLLNEGSAYNPYTGIFTATTSGVYQFTVHVCNVQKKATVLGIVHNDNTLAVSTQYSDPYSSCGSVGALVKVDVGDTVYVRNSHGLTHIQEDVHRRASFIGFRVN